MDQFGVIANQPIVIDNVGIFEMPSWPYSTRFLVWYLLIWWLNFNPSFSLRDQELSKLDLQETKSRSTTSPTCTSSVDIPTLPSCPLYSASWTLTAHMYKLNDSSSHPVWNLHDIVLGEHELKQKTVRPHTNDPRLTSSRDTFSEIQSKLSRAIEFVSRSRHLNDPICSMGKMKILAGNNNLLISGFIIESEERCIFYPGIVVLT